ncbi:MAG TPA: hypothetical protein ENI87_01990 [bacterium]|nr:hypothetical protein [bacterium]
MLANRLLPAALIAVLASGCSSLPDKSWPAHRDTAFTARFVVGDDGLLAFPTTGPELIVRELRLEPAPRGERFAGDRRWFLFAAGTTVTARGRLRIYRDRHGHWPSIDRLLPHARATRSGDDADR